MKSVTNFRTSASSLTSWHITAKLPGTSRSVTRRTTALGPSVSLSGMQWNTELNRTATGCEKSIRRWVSGWEKISSVARMSAWITAVWSFWSSRARPWTSTIGSLST
ncbi:hypothetical protein STENM327S_06356 [Streptomyces tendae]